MHSRRAIRESAIQFLYCSDLEGGAAAEELCETFWELALESNHNQLVKASAKAILHFNQGRDARFQKLVERSPDALALISADPNAERLKMNLEGLLKLENKWQAITDRVQRLYNPGNETPAPELVDALKEVYQLNQQLSECRKRWQLALQDFPFLNQRLDAIKPSIVALQRVSDRITMVEKPESVPNHPDIRHLQDTNSKISSFRNAVDKLARAVLTHKVQIDSQIEEIVTNYKPERIDPVDRATLRLGAYEILFDATIPAAVSINECIEISRRFGSTESPRFINGILDKLAKSNPEQIIEKS